MIGDEYAIRLSEYCFDVCEALKDALRGKNPCDLGESEKTKVQNLERCVDRLCSPLFAIRNNSRVMRRVECNLRRAVASTPHTKYNKERVENYMRSARQILVTLRTSRLSLGGDRSGGQRMTTTGMA